MARFDVYRHPDSALRKTTFSLLDVQNDYISGLPSRVANLRAQISLIADALDALLGAY